MAALNYRALTGVERLRCDARFTSEVFVQARSACRQQMDRIVQGGHSNMRKLLLLLAAAALLAVSGAAVAKTSSVTITKNGYVPNALAIAQGDTVQFTNSDTV